MLEGDKQALQELAHDCKDAKEVQRLRALYALSIGQSIKVVCSIFCVDESTVHRWINRWKHERNLSDKSREGRPPSFSDEEKKELKRLVEENNLKKHGTNASCWDCKELQQYFFMKGRAVSQDTIRRYLKEMGAHYIKANLKYAEADRKQQEEFARQFFEDMKSKPNSVIVLFQDEMSVGCSPKKGYGWTFEERLIVKAPQKGRRKRLNCFGAVNPLEGKVIEMSSSKAKAPAFIRFLEKIEREYPGKRIWIYLDNLAVHGSKKVEGFLKKHRRFELRFIPPYSPDLNPQEQWWNYKRKKLLNNQCFKSTHQLATAISWFVRKTQPEQVMSVCTLTPLESLLH